jgi:hypothetical protein
MSVGNPKTSAGGLDASRYSTGFRFKANPPMMRLPARAIARNSPRRNDRCPGARSLAYYVPVCWVKAQSARIVCRHRVRTSDIASSQNGCSGAERNIISEIGGFRFCPNAPIGRTRRRQSGRNADRSPGMGTRDQVLTWPFPANSIQPVVASIQGPFIGCGDGNHTVCAAMPKGRIPRPAPRYSARAVQSGTGGEPLPYPRGLLGAPAPGLFSRHQHQRGGVDARAW